MRTFATKQPAKKLAKRKQHQIPRRSPLKVYGGRSLAHSLGRSMRSNKLKLKLERISVSFELVLMRGAY